MLKDFDITQIDKDTKVVVFHIPTEAVIGDFQSEGLINYFAAIKKQLSEIGITPLFIDSSMSVTPLTDELLNCGNLKTLEK